MNEYEIHENPLFWDQDLVLTFNKIMRVENSKKRLRISRFKQRSITNFYMHTDHGKGINLKTIDKLDMK